MPRYSYSPNLDPYQDVQYHDTSPDWGAAAASTAMLANVFSQREQNNRALDLEQTRMQMENNRANNAAVLDYMKQVRQDRLLESQQAMEMLKLGTEMREVNYRMDQAKKMDEAKWRARDARQQYFSLIPRLEQKLRERDLIGAEDDLSLAYQIPGISDDEFSVKHLGEVSGLMSKFTIDGKPAVQVLRGIKGALQTAGPDSPAWSEFKQLAQEFPTDLRRAAESIAATRKEDPARADLYETYLRQMTNIMTPEKQAEMESTLAAQRAAMNQALQNAMVSGDYEQADEISANFGILQERTKQMYMNGGYSPFYSSSNPTETPAYLTKVTQNIKQQTDAAISYLNELNGNLKIRAAFGRAKMNLNSPEVAREVEEEGTPAQREAYRLLLQSPQVWDSATGRMDDKAVAAIKNAGGELSMLDEFFTREGKAVRDYQADLDFKHSLLLGQIARIASSPGSVTDEDWAALMQAKDAYGALAAPFNGGVNPVSGNFFNKQFVDQIERTRRKNRAKSTLGGPTSTSSLTPTPASSIPFAVSNKPR